jgi:glycyl-tRNA synthetase
MHHCDTLRSSQVLFFLLCFVWRFFVFVCVFFFFRASGHVEKFSDFMVKDSKTGDIYRADKLLEEWVDGQLEANPTMAEETKKELLLVRAHADAYNQSELGEVFTKYSIMAPQTGNPLSPPEPFNLSFVLPFVCFFPLFQVFKTSIGPAGDRDAFLRPETAQGIFVNFRRLLEENNSRLPFAAAQIGLSYRNEIAPRDKLLRVREFQQAEIEHFCDFESSEHPKLPFVLDTICSFWTSDAQTCCVFFFFFRLFCFFCGFGNLVCSNTKKS